MKTDKEKIVAHYEHSMSWVHQLANLSEKQWRTPIAKGKWTVAEIIGHLIPWDDFVLHQRIPYLFTESNFPKSPNTEEMNRQASKDSQKKSKEEIIDRFIDSRQRLIHAINGLPDELWPEHFSIGNSTLTLFHYFSGLIEHDEHHIRQIQKALTLG